MDRMMMMQRGFKHGYKYDRFSMMRDAQVSEKIVANDTSEL